MKALLERIFIALHLRESEFDRTFRLWKIEHLRPGEFINRAYFIGVLDSGKNEMAQNWGKHQNREGE